MAAVTDIIFDLDGTLIDSAPSILKTFSAVLEKHNIRPEVLIDHSLIGPPLIDTLSKITGATEKSLLGQLASDFKTIYDADGYKASRAFPGVDLLLRSLSEKKIGLHVATNKRIAPTQSIIGYFGWCGLFKSVFSSDSSPAGLLTKAEMLGDLLRSNRIDPARSFYVGDTMQDFLAASHNKLKFVYVSWGYGSLNVSSDISLVTRAEDILSLIKCSGLMNPDTN